MRKSSLHNHLIVSAMLAVALLLAASEAGDHHHRYWMPINNYNSKNHHNNHKLGVMPCRGKIAGNCRVEDDDMNVMVESEVSNRRILATTQYISYGALTANSVPCSISGASYYNCQPGAEANPYMRACTAITQCRS